MGELQTIFAVKDQIRFYFTSNRTNLNVWLNITLKCYPYLAV